MARRGVRCVEVLAGIGTHSPTRAAGATSPALFPGPGRPFEVRAPAHESKEQGVSSDSDKLNNYIFL